MAEELAPSQSKIRSIRIVARNPPAGQRAKGQETHVYAVREDGTLEELTNVVRVSWRVDSRVDYCEATLVVHGAEIDADAEAETYETTTPPVDGFLGKKTAP